MRQALRCKATKAAYKSSDAAADSSLWHCVYGAVKLAMQIRWRILDFKLAWRMKDACPCRALSPPIEHDFITTGHTETQHSWTPVNTVPSYHSQQTGDDHVPPAADMPLLARSGSRHSLRARSPTKAGTCLWDRRCSMYSPAIAWCGPDVIAAQKDCAQLRHLCRTHLHHDAR